MSSESGILTPADKCRARHPQLGDLCLCMLQHGHTGLHQNVDGASYIEWVGRRTQTPPSLKESGK